MIKVPWYLIDISVDVIMLLFTDAVGSNVLIMPPVTGGHISLAMASNPLASLRQSPYVPIRPQSFISVPGRNIQEGLLKSFPKEAVNMTGK